MNDLSTIFEQKQILAILIATGVGVVFGGLWYWYFAGAFQNAVRGDGAAGGTDRGIPPASYFLGSLMAFLMAVVLWTLFVILGREILYSPLIAAFVAALMWAGFAFTSLLLHAILTNTRYKLAAIEGGSQLVQAVLMAVVLYYMM